MLVAQCGERGKIFNRRERQGRGERGDVQPSSLPATILPGYGRYNIDNKWPCLAMTWIRVKLLPKRETGVEHPILKIQLFTTLIVAAGKSLPQTGIGVRRCCHAANGDGA
jgi:hypothetical protein